MEQLRNEVQEAGESYINKMKSVRKRMQRAHGQLEQVSKEMTRRQIVVGHQPTMAQPGQANAGFLPQD